MPWQRNKRLVAQGFRDLKHLPRERCGWDCTLGALAYGVRVVADRSLPDLNAWAVRHGLPAGARCETLGADALVLWHGTSQARAEKIAEHGLFHKRGLWTTTDPKIAHGFCRGRSERFGTEGAVACLVLDRRDLVEGRDFELEGMDNIYRFRQGLPPDVVEYLLLHEEVRFLGGERAPRPSAWPSSRFKKRSGDWVPVSKPPVRYDEATSYATVPEFAELCLRRLLAELDDVAALEVFSTLYALISPWDALRHEQVLEIIDANCRPHRQRGKWQTFRARH